MPDLKEIARDLSSYLGAPVARMSVLASGWETTVFEFTLESQSPVCAQYSRRPVGRAALLPGLRRGRKRQSRTRHHRSTFRRGLFGAASAFVRGRPSRTRRAVSDHAAARRGSSIRTRSFPAAFKTFSLGFFAFVRAQARLHSVLARKRRTGRNSRTHSRPHSRLATSRRFWIGYSRSSPHESRRPPARLAQSACRVSERAPLFRDARNRSCTWITIRLT